MVGSSEVRDPEAEIRYLARSLKGEMTDIAGFLDGIMGLTERVNEVCLSVRGADRLAAELGDGSVVEVRVPRVRQAMHLVAARAESCASETLDTDINETNDRVVLRVRD